MPLPPSDVQIRFMEAVRRRGEARAAVEKQARVVVFAQQGTLYDEMHKLREAIEGLDAIELEHERALALVIADSS